MLTACNMSANPANFLEGEASASRSFKGEIKEGLGYCKLGCYTFMWVTG